MGTSKLNEEILKAAAEIAAKTALETYTKEKDKDRKKRLDRRLRDTKRLMKSYREIKVHAGDAIASLSEIADEDYEFFKNLMEGEDNIDVSAIVRTKARSAIMLTHIDAMLQAYEVISHNSKKPEDQRRFRVLEAMYLKGEPVSAAEIAEIEQIDTRTVYKDINAACEKMGALLFGINWLDQD